MSSHCTCVLYRHLSVFLHTVGGSVRLEEIREQALLDGGIPTQGLLVQDEQEAVELHQELVQHWKHRQRKRVSVVTIEISQKLPY